MNEWEKSLIASDDGADYLGRTESPAGSFKEAKKD
jgi:hypothetical protein